MKRSLLLAALIVAVVSVVMNPGWVGAQQQAADKASASASDVDTVGTSQDEVVLRQNMKVSSTSDLILQTTSECSILTCVLTAGGPDPGPNDTASSQSGAFGQVEMWITIDDEVVPIADGNAQTDNGEVVFCNRAYARKITDAESPEDGTDTEEDYIRTRQANAFNWMAFDVGSEYDKPGIPEGDSNNNVELELHARYTRSPDDCPTRPADGATNAFQGTSCALAFVGARTLIAEVVHAINNEQTDDGTTGE